MIILMDLLHNHASKLLRWHCQDWKLVRRLLIKRSCWVGGARSNSSQVHGGLWLMEWPRAQSSTQCFNPSLHRFLLAPRQDPPARFKKLTLCGVYLQSHKELSQSGAQQQVQRLGTLMSLLGKKISARGNRQKRFLEIVIMNGVLTQGALSPAILAEETATEWKSISSQLADGAKVCLFGLQHHQPSFAICFQQAQCYMHHTPSIGPEGTEGWTEWWICLSRQLNPFVIPAKPVSLELNLLNADILCWLQCR